MHLPKKLVTDYHICILVEILQQSNGVPLSSPKFTGNVPLRESVNNVQDTPSESNSELQVGEDPTQSGTALFCVDYETRDGSAKNGKDYRSLKGTLVSDAISKLIKLNGGISCCFDKGI